MNEERERLPVGCIGIIVDDGEESGVCREAMLAAAPAARVTSKSDDSAASADRDKLIDFPGVLRRVPAARSTIYEWMRLGVFPSGRRVGPRKRLWRESEIDAFVRGM